MIALVVYFGNPLRVLAIIFLAVPSLLKHFNADKSKKKPGIHCRQVTLLIHLKQFSMQGLQTLLALSTNVF
jgi:hypothetical protein